MSTLARTLEGMGAIAGVMPSERIEKRIDAALDEADAALDGRDWSIVLERAEFVDLPDLLREDFPLP